MGLVVNVYRASCDECGVARISNVLEKLEHFVRRLSDEGWVFTPVVEGLGHWDCLLQKVRRCINDLYRRCRMRQRFVRLWRRLMLRFWILAYDWFMSRGDYPRVFYCLGKQTKYFSVNLDGKECKLTFCAPK